MPSATARCCHLAGGAASYQGPAGGDLDGLSFRVCVRLPEQRAREGAPASLAGASETERGPEPPPRGGAAAAAFRAAVTSHGYGRVGRSVSRTGLEQSYAPRSRSRPRHLGSSAVAGPR
ncbi:hypothetical protein X777_07754 [Ooceraea biroi]|uniref:Uncharacterized protein n=1 Tax=Ooceraea biroi TaxID=2015173 RepID=A0A026X085_OOCBI|nr:hypothetical protein X777_07754 [Ooceraea biroi]